MLFRPLRRSRLRALLRIIAARLATRSRTSDAADMAYLNRLSDERLDRDLGLLRRGRDYRPY